jgi:hypothetical protein
MLQNVIAHPYNPGLKFFMSFDYCHALQNGRNLFLDHNMASSDGIITANYLKELLGIQEKLIIKPVRYLTKKHIYPSNVEKIKVHLAVQIFSPPVIAAAGKNGNLISDCSATVKYMENMYKLFQIHDVSNKAQHIHQRDANTAPYTNTENVPTSSLVK